MYKKRFSLPDRTLIELMLADLETLMEMQEKIYPPAMVEEKAELKKILENKTPKIGVIMDQKLVGFLLSTEEYVEVENGLWLYDLGILPEYQKQGLGSLLLQHFLKETGKRNLGIFAYCRNTSYPLFSDSEKLKKMGYEMAAYKFMEDGYFEECGIHEDVHEIELRPLT